MNGGESIMYKVHKFVINNTIDEVALQTYLNLINGEIISIVPNIIPKFHLMGATAGYDFLIIIEKTED